MFGQRDLLLFGCIFLFVVACSKYFKKNNIIEGNTVKSSGIGHCYNYGPTGLDEDGKLITCNTCDEVYKHYDDLGWKKDLVKRVCERDNNPSSTDDVDQRRRRSSPPPKINEIPELKITGKYHIINVNEKEDLDEVTQNVFQYLSDISDDHKINSFKTNSVEYKKFMAETCALKVESNVVDEQAALTPNNCDFANANWISSDENNQCNSLYDSENDGGEKFREAQQRFFDQNMQPGVEDYFSKKYTNDRFPTLLLKNQNKTRIAKIIKIPCKAPQNDNLPENLCYYPKEDNRIIVPHCLAHNGLRDDIKSPEELAKICKKDNTNILCARFYHEWLPYASRQDPTVS